MKREAMEKCIAQRTAHAMRAAAIRLARERAAEEADPSLAYGCVDWFRYDVPPPRDADTEQSAAAERHGAAQVSTPLGH